MGSSQKANTKGVPSTSRTGSPVEIVGLLYFSLMKFDKLHRDGHYFKEGITYASRLISFKEWADNIKANF